MSKLILPGLIDPHVHLRDPGQTHKEDFFTGTSAALAGGYTCILDMPNNVIPITTKLKLEEKMVIAKDKIVCDVGFYFGSTGNNLDEFEKVKNKVFGLKLYLNQTTGNFLIDKDKAEMIFAKWKNSTPILLHAENNAVEFMIGIVKKTGKKTHFCHISTRDELALISQAKEKGLPITCGITPHHLFLNEHDEKILGPFGKMKPPLQSRKDVEFLWKNLHKIDVIESDHAPHTIEEKEGENPPYGVPGLETTLPLLLTAVSEGKLTIDEIIRLCHTGPAKIFGIAVDPETKVEIDIHKSYIINPKSFFSKCGWSPFSGWKLKGKVTRVFLRGEKVFENGKILAQPGFGHILTR